MTAILLKRYLLQTWRCTEVRDYTAIRCYERSVSPKGKMQSLDQWIRATHELLMTGREERNYLIVHLLL